MLLCYNYIIKGKGIETMKKYVMTIEFRNYYNDVVETKVEETTDFHQALRAFTIYIEHPECRRCIWAEFYGSKLNRIIGSFQI